MERGGRKPVLKLVGGPVSGTAGGVGAISAVARSVAVPTGSDAEPMEHPTLAVERENQRAAAMSRDDVRWIFAARVAHALDGGQRAILPPEKRRALVAEAVAAGLREFDASLVIAIVQDAARTGDDHRSSEVHSRLRLVRPVGERESEEDAAINRRAQLGLCIGLGILLTMILIRWVLK